MCMYYNRDHIQRHRPVWQCGTCGRVCLSPLIAAPDQMVYGNTLGG